MSLASLFIIFKGAVEPPYLGLSAFHYLNGPAAQNFQGAKMDNLNKIEEFRVSNRLSWLGRSSHAP